MHAPLHLALTALFSFALQARALLQSQAQALEAALEEARRAPEAALSEALEGARRAPEGLSGAWQGARRAPEALGEAWEGARAWLQPENGGEGAGRRGAAAAPMTDEERAKAAWLARQGAPGWGPPRG